MATDGDTMIRGVKNQRVFQFAQILQFLYDFPDLLIDVFAAGEFAAQLITDRGRITAVPDAADGNFIANIGMGVIEGVLRQIVGWQLWLCGTDRWWGLGIRVIDRAITGQQFRSAIASIVRV
jgi:deoxyribodipyrimidine photolyase-like uncharacterized protein